MFGWLHSRPASLCQQTMQPGVSRRWLRLTPCVLVRHLPSLGNVLYVHAGNDTGAMDACPPHLLAEQGELAPILWTHVLAIACVITDDGPREWCECIDASGQIRARLHLLPDTDYLAWDALSCLGQAITAPSPSHRVSAFVPREARVVRFRTRLLAAFTLLGQIQPVRLSSLGADLATRIANAEAMPLSAYPMAG